MQRRMTGWEGEVTSLCARHPARSCGTQNPTCLVILRGHPARSRGTQNPTHPVILREVAESTQE